MYRPILLLFITLVVFLISSCGNSNSEKKGELILSPKTETISKIVIDSLTDDRYVFLQKVMVSNSDLFIKVDYVEYLTGEKAMEAEWRDEAYFVDGTDTISNITDGYYISNVNPKIRTFKVSENAEIENIIDDNGSHKLEQKKNLSLKQLKRYIELNTLLLIHIENGIVKSIDEQFMP